MIETKTFRFRKPEGYDRCDIRDQNINWDKTECVLKSQRRQVRSIYIIMIVFLIGKIGGVHRLRLLVVAGLNSLQGWMRKTYKKSLQYE